MPKTRARNNKKNNFFILFPSSTLTLSTKGSGKTALLAVEEGFLKDWLERFWWQSYHWFLGSLNSSIFTFALWLCHMINYILKSSEVDGVWVR